MIAKTKTGITKISVLFNAIFSLPISARLRVYENTAYLHFESNKTLYVIRTTVNLYVTVPLQTVKKNFVLKVYSLYHIGCVFPPQLTSTSTCQRFRLKLSCSTGNLWPGLHLYLIEYQVNFNAYFNNHVQR